MANGDRRRSNKMKRRKGQAKKKARAHRVRSAGKKPEVAATPKKTAKKSAKAAASA